MKCVSLQWRDTSDSHIILKNFNMCQDLRACVSLRSNRYNSSQKEVRCKSRQAIGC